MVSAQNAMLTVLAVCMVVSGCDTKQTQISREKICKSAVDEKIAKGEIPLNIQEDLKQVCEVFKPKLVELSTKNPATLVCKDIAGEKLLLEIRQGVILYDGNQFKIDSWNAETIRFSRKLGRSGKYSDEGTLSLLTGRLDNRVIANDNSMEPFVVEMECEEKRM